MEDKRITDLAEKYVAGKCTDEEIILLENWYLNWAPDQISVDPVEFDKVRAEIYARLPVNLPTHSKSESRVRSFSWLRIAAAAAIAIVIGGGIFYYSNTSSSNDIHELEFASRNIKTGSNKAYLTLSSGQKISLTDVPDGSIAKEAGIEISKTADGQLVYVVQDRTLYQNKGKLNNTTKERLNTIETPNGGQYQVRLPDGTKVWLNAASSIKYASNFNTSEERKVELTGEAYFEVAKDRKHPFRVKSPGQEIVVLGTHFNINCYKEEQHVKTTLLEGSVKVSVSGYPERGLVLRPGQQSVLASKTFTVKPADIETDLAWKDGLFVFKDESLENIMHQIARWYDVEVVFEGNMAARHFEGTISRFKSISEVLRKFQLTKNVHFKIEGRRITVMP